MTLAQVTRGHKRYRYYVCSAAQRQGRHMCPSKSLPAAAIERYVLEQLASGVQRGRSELPPPPPPLSPEHAQRWRDRVARIDYDGTSRQVVITLRPKPPTPEEHS